MKKTFILSAVAFCVHVEAQYCLPTFQYGADGNMITNVTFGAINKTSPFQSGSTPDYEDFTSISTDLQAGLSYPISVTGPSSVFPSDVVVFIDFNQNGDFNDAGESFYIGRLASASPISAFTVTENIAIPSNAIMGATRMRVLKNTNTAALSNVNASNSINTACDTNLRSGQTEDYTVNITGNNSVFPAPFCGVENVSNLDVSEITKVEFAGVTKNSPIGGSSDSIENFTNIIFEVNKGVSYPISVTGATQGQTTVSAFAYIDFNHNNMFDDHEKFNLGYLDNSNAVPNVQSGITSGSIVIPADALLGHTRFRLVKAYESDSWLGVLENLACPKGWFIGQVEDYTINVQAANLSTREIVKESSKIYPNPTTGLVYIKTNEKVEKFEVYNISGQKLLEGNSTTINISDFVPGTYLIKIQTNNQKIITEKIIKK